MSETGPDSGANPYVGLAEAGDDARWAYGTGFADPLAGVNPAIPPGVDRAALAAVCLRLGDDALIYSHRLQEWITRLPELEEETAIANVALDLLGQARLLLARAGQADGTGRGDDDFAFRREPAEFRAVRLAEERDGDFAALVGRLLVLSTWRLARCRRLAGCADPVLAAVTAKAVPELTYHRDHAAAWVVRLGDGTAESRRRMVVALAALWPLVDELFDPDPDEARLHVAADQTALRHEVDAVLDEVLTAAGLDRPAAAPRPQADRPSASLTEAVDEIQNVARAHPGAVW
jgi:ring-1,2-phenylacetyl-CoA epoxidase subunit PaaC